LKKISIKYFQSELHGYGLMAVPVFLRAALKIIIDAVLKANFAIFKSMLLYAIIQIISIINIIDLAVHPRQCSGCKVFIGYVYC